MSDIHSWRKDMKRGTYAEVTLGCKVKSQDSRIKARVVRHIADAPMLHHIAITEGNRRAVRDFVSASAKNKR